MATWQNDGTSIDIAYLLRRGKLGTILNPHGGLMLLSRDAFMARNSKFLQVLEIGQARQKVWDN